jgi:hypothetical protein
MKIKYNYIIIILLILLIIGVLYYFTESKKYENFESGTQKIWSMSFAGGGQNYYDALNRINNELKQTNFFNEIIGFTDEDLKKDTEFWEKHGNFIESNKRGYGYWLWKPYLILKTLEKMKDDDILFHLDAGCEITTYGQREMDLMKQMVDNCNKLNLLYISAQRVEKSYTKMDVFEFMGMNNEDAKNSTQNAATVLIIKKNDMMVDFIKEWYTISYNYHLIDDTPSVLENDSLFNDHRHTQSTFSLLTKKHKISGEEHLIETITKETDFFRLAYPILTSRKR